VQTHDAADSAHIGYSTYSVNKARHRFVTVCQGLTGPCGTFAYAFAERLFSSRNFCKPTPLVKQRH
jgi:hypothetical protein